MSTVLTLPASSASSSAAAGFLSALAARAREFVSALRAADSVDTSDVWRLYHASRDTDSVSARAVGMLADKLKAE